MRHASPVGTFVNAYLCRMRSLTIHCCSESDSFPGSKSLHFIRCLTSNQLSSPACSNQAIQQYPHCVCSFRICQRNWVRHQSKLWLYLLCLPKLLWTQHDFFILTAPEGSSTEETHGITGLSSVCQVRGATGIHRRESLEGIKMVAATDNAALQQECEFRFLGSNDK